MPSLEQEFTQAMFDIYRRAKVEAGYNASIFFQMISDRGGVRTAKALINGLGHPRAIRTCTSEVTLKLLLKQWWSRTRNGTSYSRRRRLPVLVSGSKTIATSRRHR
jgi:hypothetical protein